MSVPCLKHQKQHRSSARHTAMGKLKEMGLTRGRAQWAAKDQSHWKQIDEVLCPTRDEDE